VVFDAVLKLLHQRDRLALDYCACAYVEACDEVTVDVTAVLGGCANHKAVREWIRAGYVLCERECKGLFVMMILYIRTGFVLYEDPNWHGGAHFSRAKHYVGVELYSGKCEGASCRETDLSGVDSAAGVGVTLARTRGRLYGELSLFSFFNGLVAKYFIVSVAIRMASFPRVFFLARRLAFSVVRAMPA